MLHRLRSDNQHSLTFLSRRDFSFLRLRTGTYELPPRANFNDLFIASRAVSAKLTKEWLPFPLL